MRKIALAAAICGVAVGLTGGAASAKQQTNVVAMATTFSPTTVTISAGQKVTWSALEGSHTVTMRKGNFSKPLSGSGKVTRKFKDPGKFKYFCIPHESLGMKGKVVVN